MGQEQTHVSVDAVSHACVETKDRTNKDEPQASTLWGITVTLLSGATMEFKVHPTDLVKDLKLLVEKKNGVQATLQTLFAESQETCLSDSQTLDKSGLADGALVFLLRSQNLWEICTKETKCGDNLTYVRSTALGVVLEFSHHSNGWFRFMQLQHQNLEENKGQMVEQYFNIKLQH
jgi:hypothetical protein